jgi:hypothetical protein
MTYVRGHIVLLVEGLGLGGGHLADLALPADAAAPIGMRDIGCGKELLDHAAVGEESIRIRRSSWTTSRSL